MGTILLVDSDGNSVGPLQGTRGGQLLAATGKLSSGYIYDITMDGMAQVIEIPEGVDEVCVINRGAIGEPVRFIFGTDATVAATGLNIQSGAATAGIWAGTTQVASGTEGPEVRRGIPAWATHLGVCNAVAGTTPDVVVEF